eukprot:scaffold7356_cov249-Pinguiococcus_pyrenoidosus.AAC.14
MCAAAEEPRCLSESVPACPLTAAGAENGKRLRDCIRSGLDIDTDEQELLYSFEDLCCDLSAAQQEPLAG